jgi:ubiquinone/menaquinone biosynthesis C-methylase UbiE
VTADDLQAHYAGQDEGRRLDRTPHGRLELIRTQELLQRLLPAPPARVLDVGGGTGLYADWLAGLGYDVHLVDVVPLHVDTALAYGTFSAAVGDARDLDAGDETCDAVLLLGPLYHLVSADDRLTALSEARRVTRPGGAVVAAAIGRYMALLDWCAAGELSEETLAKLLPVIATGRHDPSLGFTDAYFHTADELAGELREAGLRDVQVVGIEGPAWIAADAAGVDRFDEYVESAVRCARAVETDPALLASSAHLLAVGTR